MSAREPPRSSPLPTPDSTTNQIALARTAFEADTTPFTHALSESYMGYFQCMYALNAAHGKFTKLYKTVFPAGLDAHAPSSSSASLPTKQDSLAPPGRLSHAPVRIRVRREREHLRFAPAFDAAPAPAPSLPPSSRSLDAGAHRRRPSYRLGGSLRHRTRDGAPRGGPVEEMIGAGTALGAFLPFPAFFWFAEGPVEEMVVGGTAFGMCRSSLPFLLSFCLVFLGGGALADMVVVRLDIAGALPRTHARRVRRRTPLCTAQFRSVFLGRTTLEARDELRRRIVPRSVG
ncbi:hypothetical protein B0H12DRAFT_1244781 [Mycena haematopus]|nr:hypothetical protein B0H12DRAFT_1244781 [Mycena haematopus]